MTEQRKEEEVKLFTSAIQYPVISDRTSQKIRKLSVAGINNAARKNKMCVVGDLNFPHINWNNLTGNSEAEDFLEAVLDNFLEHFRSGVEQQGKYDNTTRDRGGIGK